MSYIFYCLYYFSSNKKGNGIKLINLISVNKINVELKGNKEIYNMWVW